MRNDDRQDPSALLTANAAWIERLADHARRLQHINPPVAAELAGAAATVAWLNHAGTFALPQLEQLCLDLAAREIGHHPAPSPRRSILRPDATVVHVLSQAYDTGGHTRLVWRWITADAPRRHRVVLTDHRDRAVPALLRDALGPDDLRLLPASGDGPLGVAAQLAAACADADLVVVHHHPNDLTPLLAFGGRTDRPPVAVLNHAEHWYWSGTAVADNVICYEEKGARISRARRGIDADRIGILPLPLDHRPVADKAAAKAAIGLDPDAVVFLTVARAGKFEAEGQPHLADVLQPFVHATPGAVVVAVGPEDTGVWEQARLATGGRIRAVGRRHPLEPWIDAADVALESYPLGSTTALLEAVMAGAVPVTFRFDPDVVALFTSDPFGPAHVLIDTVQDVTAVLGRLATDTDHRADLAQRCRADVLAANSDAAFRAALEALYTQIDRSLPRLTPTSSDHGADGADRFLVRQLQAERSAVGDEALHRVLAQAAAAPSRPELSVILVPNGGTGIEHLLGEVTGLRVEWLTVLPTGPVTAGAGAVPGTGAVPGAVAVPDVNTAVTRSRGGRVLIVRDDLVGDDGWVHRLLATMDHDPTAVAVVPLLNGAPDAAACTAIRGVAARAGWTLPLTPSTVRLRSVSPEDWTSFLVVPRWDEDFAHTMRTYLRAFAPADRVTLVVADASGRDLADQVTTLEQLLDEVDAERPGSDGLADIVLSRLDREPTDNGRGRLVWLGRADDPQRPAGTPSIEGPLDVERVRRVARRAA